MFTRDLLRPKAGSKIKRKLRIDSKGRISIPADVRRSFGLENGDKIYLYFDLGKNKLILFLKENGQDGVEVRTDGCGPSGPGSIARQSRRDCLEAGNPGPGLKEKL